MKKNSFSLMILAIASLLIFSSCKKDSGAKSPSGANAALSFWQGTITQNADLNIQHGWSFGLYTNNKLIIYLGNQSSSDTATASKLYGTYTLSGNNFSGTFNDTNPEHGTVSLTGNDNITDSPNELTGNFTGSSGIYHGTFDLKKK